MQEGKHSEEQPPEPHIIVHEGRNGARPRVSLTMIVKNEEDNLPDCLTSVADLVDEIVIVDTGSSDGTMEVAARFGAKVFAFPWVDSFAAARNESLKHATGDWIFWMDADDRLDAENRQRFHRLIDNLPEGPNGFVMKCLCLPNLEAKTATEVDHMRLFRNHPEVRWRYRVHEQIVPAIRKLGGAFQWLDEALPLFRRSLERSDPTDSIVRKLYALIAQCHNHLGKPGEALAVCREGRVHYADDVEILFQEATAHRHLGDTEAAIRSWEQVLQTPPGPHFASMNTGIRGHLTRHNLAAAYFDLGRLDPAEAHWNAALAEQPDYVPALLGKAELTLKRRRWQDLEEVLQPLARQAQTAVDAVVLRARMHLDRKEFTCARDMLESTIAAHPRAIWPRVILTHVLLQEGKDWPAAERALRDVLALDPEHQEAQRNLEVLLCRQRKIA